LVTGGGDDTTKVGNPEQAKSNHGFSPLRRLLRAKHYPGGVGPAVHGMLAVGVQPIYLYHLPLFHAPHDFQVILEVSFSKPGSDSARLYAEDRAHSGEPIYTFSPEPFVLPRLAGAVGELPKLTSFTGTLFRGHFERGGTPLVDRVKIEVRGVVHFRQFERGIPTSPRLEYIVFGCDSPPLAARFLSGPPDFDQIVEVSVREVGGGALPEESFQVSVPGRVNSAASRLQKGQSEQAQLITTTAPSREFQLAIDNELYLETAELAS
jgi:hypothetical protein